MTEEEWLTSDDPTPMHSFLTWKRNERKLRFFIVAACRHSFRSFGHYELDEVVDWAEEAVDQQPRTEAPASVRETVTWAISEMCESLNRLGDAAEYSIATAIYDPYAGQQVTNSILAAHEIADVNSTPMEEAQVHCTFLRDIFGNPFRPVTFNPNWLTSDVTAMARGMYETRDFAAMPILADALQDAGCENADVLEHCRGPGPHVRGCWVVDLVLGKE